MYASRRMPAFMHPAGQVTTSNTTAQDVLNALSSTSQMAANAIAGKPPTAVGVNSSNQYVDAAGNLIKDANGNAIVASSDMTVSASVPKRSVLGMLLSLAVTVAVVGGSAYAGSYYGSRRAARRSDRTRSRRTA